MKLSALIEVTAVSGMIVFFGLSTAGCAASKHVRPHDQSLVGHQRSAKIAKRNAEHYEFLAETATDPAQIGIDWNLAAYYREHAKEHSEAGNLLAASGDPEACLGDADAKNYRSTCPLATYKIASVKRLEDGIEVEYLGIDAAELKAHVRCHLAHAKMMGNGSEDNPSCPLLGNGIKTQVESVSAGRSKLIIEATDPGTVAHIQGIYVRAAPAKVHP